MQRLDVGSGFASPWRLTVFWLQAEEEDRARREAIDKRWRMAVDQELGATGVFRRVAEANSAIATTRFGELFVERQEERAAAKSENDLALLARSILADLGVDLADIHIRLRRALPEEMTRMLRRIGGAQVKLRATPTVEVAQLAIDRAAAKGYVRPGSPATSPDAVASAASDLTHSGQGTSGV